MTESEYILAGDLRSVRHAIAALREIIPANDPQVPANEHQTVMRLLSEWQDRMFTALPELGDK